MSIRAALIASLLFTAVTLVPTGSHLASLPNKIGMSAPDYLVAQRAYDGWNLSAFLVLGALIATGAFLWAVRHERELMSLAVAAFACMVGTQIVFWTMNFPGNQQTMNWTHLPAHWQDLRQRWEYGHAASCLLNLCAFAALLLATWRLLRRQ